MNEALTKATHSAQFALDDLREALKASDPVASLLLEGLVADAYALSRRVINLACAIEDRGAQS
jgi:hypothetical protein